MSSGGLPCDLQLLWRDGSSSADEHPPRRCTLRCAHSLSCMHGVRSSSAPRTLSITSAAGRTYAVDVRMPARAQRRSKLACGRVRPANCLYQLPRSTAIRPAACWRTQILVLTDFSSLSLTCSLRGCICTDSVCACCSQYGGVFVSWSVRLLRVTSMLVWSTCFR